jgi:hypothetical protein
MLTETAGSILCEAEEGVELGDFPIRPIMRTRKLKVSKKQTLFKKNCIINKKTQITQTIKLGTIIK